MSKYHAKVRKYPVTQPTYLSLKYMKILYLRKTNFLLTYD